MSLVARYPDLDYSTVRAHWARNLMFALDRNAASIIPAPVEPWLIRIVQSVVDRLPEARPALREAALGFIRQESQHFKQHRLFNAALISQGYPRLAEFEQRLAQELDDFFRKRSLKFCLAYADGFESLGAISGQIWFEQSADMLEGADPSAVALWKWHMAEEFEHREVCFDIYHALFGRGLWNAVVNGYVYRVYGFVFAMAHLRGHIARIQDYMLQVDLQSMTQAQRRQLQLDAKAFKAFQRKTFLAPLLKNFLPWYNPRRKRVPRGLMEYLKLFETGGPHARAKPTRTGA